MPIDRDKERLDDRPPFFRSWSAVYALVLGFLGFLIIAFFLFTRHYQ